MTDLFHKRYLIVNADDFGQSPGVNRGVMLGHENGIVTSASLMVRWPAAAEAAAYSRKHPELSVGLHVDLAEWLYRDGKWSQHYQVVPTNDLKAVAIEVDHQLARFRELMGKDPTHLDSHQHVHREEGLSALMLSVAGRLGVPLRHFDPRVRYCGNFYGQMNSGLPLLEAIAVDGLLRILDELPEGVSELACHPAAESDLDSMYGGERGIELETLCDPRVKQALAERSITLCSFACLGYPTP